MPEIGDKMQHGPPAFIVGQPEANSWRLQDAFNRELKQYIEDTTIQAVLATLEAEMGAIADALAGVLRTTITDALGNSAMGKDVYGSTIVSSHDQRLENLLVPQLERIAQTLEGINAKLAVLSGCPYP